MSLPTFSAGGNIPIRLLGRLCLLYFSPLCLKSTALYLDRGPDYFEMVSFWFLPPLQSNTTLALIHNQNAEININ
jgi:hypothetical protein